MYAHHTKNYKKADYLEATKHGFKAKNKAARWCDK